MQPDPANIDELTAIIAVIYHSLPSRDYGPLATWLLDTGCSRDEAMTAVTKSTQWPDIKDFAIALGKAQCPTSS